MKYIIVTKKWCDNHGIIIPSEARKSINGDKVIFHESYILPVIKDLSTVNSYEHDSKELMDILNSKEWTEEDVNNEIQMF